MKLRFTIGLASCMLLTILVSSILLPAQANDYGTSRQRMRSKVRRIDR